MPALPTQEMQSALSSNLSLLEMLILLSSVMDQRLVAGANPTMPFVPTADREKRTRLYIAAGSIYPAIPFISMRLPCLTFNRYVQMLERQQEQLVAGVHELYRRILTGQGWPGPRIDTSMCGQPLTHKILEGLDVLQKDGFDDASALKGMWDASKGPLQDATKHTDAAISPDGTQMAVLQDTQTAFGCSQNVAKRRSKDGNDIFAAPALPVSSKPSMPLPEDIDIWNAIPLVHGNTQHRAHEIEQYGQHNPVTFANHDSTGVAMLPAFQDESESSLAVDVDFGMFDVVLPVPTLEIRG